MMLVLWEDPITVTSPRFCFTLWYQLRISEDGLSLIACKALGERKIKVLCFGTLDVLYMSDLTPFPARPGSPSEASIHSIV